MVFTLSAWSLLVLAYFMCDATSLTFYHAYSSHILRPFNIFKTTIDPSTSLSATIKPLIPDLKGVKNKIYEIVDADRIQSVRLRHIQLETEDMALYCKKVVSNGSMEFPLLAQSVSLCERTKALGGEIGWVKIGSDDDGEDHVVNTLGTFPPELLNAAVNMNKGDLTIVSSIVTTTVDSMPAWHLVQLMDVMTKLSPAMKKRKFESFMMKQKARTRGRESLNSVPAHLSALTRNDISSTTIGTSKSGNDSLLFGEGEIKLTYTIDTMGCQMNVADSERIEGQLSKLGYSPFTDMATTTGPDVVIINTCSIRDHAEQKVYSYIGPHAARKRKGEDVSIIVAGCVAQQEGETLVKRFPEIDVVMGPQYANRIGDLLSSVFDGNQVVATQPSYQMEDSAAPLRRHSDVSAFVNIIYGCNERCTYCVVPNTRGVEQSRTIDAIVTEIADLVKHGYKEVTLLGQNVDSWGRDMNPKQRFADLLIAVANVKGIERVRFLTSHPKYMSKRVIQAVAQYPNLMPHFNVPFQSGDNNILQLMRRGYTRERYLNIVRAIRELQPDAAIVADCIVGFPGEMEQQFQATLSLMEEVQFDQLNTAAYSPRPNTPAAIWANQVPDDVKQDRLQRINRLGTQHALSRSRRFLGRTEEVLVEDVNLKHPTQVVGRNPQGRLVYFDGSIADLKGRIVPVRITKAKAYSLVGELVHVYSSTKLHSQLI